MCFSTAAAKRALLATPLRRDTTNYCYSFASATYCCSTLWNEACIKYVVLLFTDVRSGSIFFKLGQTDPAVPLIPPTASQATGSPITFASPSLRLGFVAVRLYANIER